MMFFLDTQNMLSFYLARLGNQSQSFVLHIDNIGCDTRERDIYRETILRAERHNTLSHTEVIEGLMFVCA